MHESKEKRPLKDREKTEWLKRTLNGLAIRLKSNNNLLLTCNQIFVSSFTPSCGLYECSVPGCYRGLPHCFYQGMYVYVQWNPMKPGQLIETSFEMQSNETLCSACWLVHLWQFADTQGSVLELSRRQWTCPTRWVQQCQMGSECGGTSTFFVQCWCIWPLTILTLSIYFQSWPSPMCILENHQFLFCRHCNLFNLQPKPHFALGCQITPITRVWVKGFEHETRKSQAAIQLERFGQK